MVKLFLVFNWEKKVFVLYFFTNLRKEQIRNWESIGKCKYKMCFLTTKIINNYK